MNTEQIARHANERGCSAALIGTIVKMNINGMNPPKILSELDKINIDGWEYYRPYFIELVEEYYNL